MPVRDPEKRRAVQRAWREKNKDRIKAAAKAYYEANRGTRKRYYKPQTPEQRKTYYERNRDRMKAQSRARTVRLDATPRGRLLRMLSVAKCRANKAGLPFDISEDDLRIPTTCPILCIPIRLDAEAPLANRPSLDRILNEKGYVKGNVAVISTRANSYKSNLAPEQIRRLLVYMEAAELLG